jgi:hypothetical protein
VTACFLGRDLLFYARVADAAERAGVQAQRVDSPEELPPPSDVSLLVVDWGNRFPNWDQSLREWCASATDVTGPRVILFGPHTDMAAHAAARQADLGPMWARSKLVSELSNLFAAVRA